MGGGEILKFFLCTCRGGREGWKNELRHFVSQGIRQWKFEKSYKSGLGIPQHVTALHIPNAANDKKSFFLLLITKKKQAKTS